MINLQLMGNMTINLTQHNGNNNLARDLERERESCYVLICVRFSSYIAVRISEKMSCEESATFFANLAYISHIIDKITQTFDQLQ